MALTSVVISAKAKQTATVLWFHGLGDTGSGWSFLASQLSTLFPYVKWILPNAPVRPITLNSGYPMPAWFDMSGLNKTSNEDESGMLNSITSVSSIIAKEIENGIPSERIIVGGFSQGSVLALLTGLTSDLKLAGIIGCSGWLGMASKFPGIATEANKKTPILMCHGGSDPVVSPEYGRISAEKLKSFGYNLDFKMYPGLVHSANDDEILDIARFIKKNLPPV